MRRGAVSIQSIEAGVDLPTIMAKVGHDDMDTTLGIYLHMTQKMKQDASQKVQTAYGDLLNLSFFTQRM